jgi:hypothetical protein
MTIGLDWGSLSAADWGVLLTAVFTALAAAAAWRTVVLDSRRQRAANNPSLSGTFAVVGNDQQRIEITSAGPGLAVGTAYFGVNAGRKFGGFFAKTTLLPGERTRAVLPPGYVQGPHVDFIWWCRDFPGRLHVWSHHAGYKVLSPETDAWPGEADLFGLFYPGPIPPGQIQDFPTE